MLLLGLLVSTSVVFSILIISVRNNPEEVIGGADIQLLIDQVNKLAMLPGEEIIHVHKSLKLMVSLKLKSQ
jgi:hypothetical protein